MSEYLFTATEFAEKCLDLAKNHKTVYALGMWGWQLTREAINTKARQLPSFYNAAKKASLYKLADEGGYWGFDCVCMIKAFLWGWDGSDSPRGGAKYASNGVPDFGADSIGRYCNNYTTDFSRVKVGEALHMSGHVGVYIGHGLAVECTAAWEGKVIITAVGNIGKVSGYHTRTWTHHGELIWIDYNEEDQGMTPKERKELDELESTVATLQGEIAELKKANDELKKANDELKKAVDTQNKIIDEHSTQLKVYHYWPQIKDDVPWAYKPLRALYDAGIFSGASPSDLAINRTKLESLVCLASSLKKNGMLNY